MTTMHAAQAETLATASRKGTHWTQTELDMVKEDRSIKDLAKELNRTWYAVATARKVAQERGERVQVTTRKVELPYDRGFTTLEAMGF